MKNKSIISTFVIILLILNSISCKETNNQKIERFVWIRSNINWIWQPSDLKALEYLEYFDSSKKVKYAHSTISIDSNNLRSVTTSYFQGSVPDSLRILIIYCLFNKNYKTAYPLELDPYTTYSGHPYCIIYKFENHQERIINYYPISIPDSLKILQDYLLKRNGFKLTEVTNQFDIKSIVDKYRDSIIGDIPLAPPPPPIDEMVFNKLNKK
jgi:hypothetical protein